MLFSVLWLERDDPAWMLDPIADPRYSAALRTLVVRHCGTYGLRR